MGGKANKGYVAITKTVCLPTVGQVYFREKESMFDVSIATIISKRRYGMKTEGNLAETKSEMKSETGECLWL